MNGAFDALYGGILDRIQAKLPFDFDMSAFAPHKKRADAAAFADVLSEKMEEAEESADESAIAETSRGETSQAVFTGDVRDSAVNAAMAGISPDIYNAVLKACAENNVDVNLVKGVIKQESDYDVYSLSHSGAMGLMQLMPGTAEGLGVTDPYSISQNVSGGVKYLSQMLEMFGGDEALALAAYNAGSNAVKKYGGIPPYAETQAYVPKVLGYKEKYFYDAP